ncbi:hypothetical protein, partial [Citrobacter portucalensis]|uniref:hypothetical protein n=1 Tax=Citrobacter portucalensis TaxID=1639133 RepID=UPI00196ACBEF
IAWSLVQVQQGPPNFKDLREIAGPFVFPGILRGYRRKMRALPVCSNAAENINVICRHASLVYGDPDI